MEEHKLPTPIVALLPVLVLILLVAITILLFGGDALSGASQFALLLASAFTLILGKLTVRAGWHRFETQLIKNFKNIVIALFILLIIGGLSATWMISGVVPLFIVYGMKLISPDVFLVSACVISSLVSMLTGSSWTTVATIGIALNGVGQALGISEGWIAGAIISGAYFGDKMSPLSDTTIMASSVTGTPLFTHIRYMVITTFPSMLITLIVFLIAGFYAEQSTFTNTEIFTKTLGEKFNLSPWLLIVPVFTVFLIIKRYPPLVTLFLSMLAALVFALIFQPGIISEIAGGGKDIISVIKGSMMTVFGPTDIQADNETIRDLIATKGMQGMLNTIWIIICASCFGAAMTSTGMIESLTKSLIRHVHSTTGLVSSTVLTGLLTNLTMGDQYLGLILTGNIFKKLYAQKGYESRLLSRTLEDSVTVTSVLVPWNSCGMTQSTVLGISTFVYLPFAVFCYISPLMSIIIAAINYRIKKEKPVLTGNEEI
jgi:NhaC family Na+:H+ antiporter